MWLSRLTASRRARWWRYSMGAWYAYRTVLEGHRFAVKSIPKDHGLYSWNMQFGTAVKDIHPGEYIMNERGMKALRTRRRAG